MKYRLSSGNTDTADGCFIIVSGSYSIHSFDLAAGDTICLT
ncbi:hypothetical protein DSUL_170004 [Desulfovibrionales bacterium]